MIGAVIDNSSKIYGLRQVCHPKLKIYSDQEK
jgi:hypothetical protein